MLDAGRVRAICEARWKAGRRGKRANTADPMLGQDCTWADIIDVCEGAAVGVVEKMLQGTGWRKRETIAMRRIVDTCFRNASEPANFYAMPLYVSEGMLLEMEKAAESRSKWPPDYDEHVLPLAIYASGTNLLADPVRCIPDLRKALVGPICMVTSDENRRLDTKKHPDPDHPFMRYRDKVQAYRVADGMPIDPLAWTFQDHVDHMKTVPAYSTGAVRYENGRDLWAGVRGTLALDRAA